MRPLLIALRLWLTVAAGASAHTSETRVIGGSFCQIRYITTWTLWNGDHGHLTYTPWYFFRCHW